MILVDVNVPAIQKNYDFMLQENVTVRAVIDEVVELICQKEGFPGFDGSFGFDLFSCKTGAILDEKKSVIENGIATGDRIILV